jgi:hypothetical protein
VTYRGGGIQVAGELILPEATVQDNAKITTIINIQTSISLQSASTSNSTIQGEKFGVELLLEW